MERKTTKKTSAKKSAPAKSSASKAAKTSPKKRAPKPKVEGVAKTAAEVRMKQEEGSIAPPSSRLVSAFDMFHRDGMTMFHRLWDGLGAIEGVTRYGPGPDRPRTPTLSFTVDGASSEQVARALAEKGVFVSNGDFYATTIVRLLGHGDTGLVRAGISMYTSEEEIDRLIAAVREVAQR